MPNIRLSAPLAALLALAAGAAAALGFEPWNLLPLTIIGIAALVGLVDTARSGPRAAMLGWLFGVGHFALALAWIATAFTFQAKMPPALGWVAVVGLSMFLALYIALAAGLARMLVRDPLARILVLAVTFMLGEWLRGWVLSGFAWDPLGAAWMSIRGIRQLAQFGGSLALSGLMVLVGGGIWLLVKPGVALGERLTGAVLIIAITITGLASTRLNRDHYYPDNPRVHVVQPNIGQDQKYVANAQEAHLQAYLDLTAAALAADRQDSSVVARPAETPPADVAAATTTATAAPVAPQPDAPGAPALPATGTRSTAFAADRPETGGAIIVWSESAVPYAVEEDPAIRARLAAVLGPADLLLFGGVAVIRNDAGEVLALTNSLFVLDAKGKIHGRYDKSHLVPLGEYVPARPLMTRLGLARLAPGDLDFRPGPGPRTLALPGFPPVGVQICYEIIFPGAVVQPGKRPGWLVNISNDAWFGPTGPPQHLAQARLRAIEEGLPIVRATPTGISAIIDGHGNITASQPAGTAGVATERLPPALPATPFARFGHGTTAIFGLVLLIIAFAIDRSRRA